MYDFVIAVQNNRLSLTQIKTQHVTYEPFDIIELGSAKN